MDVQKFRAQVSEPAALQDYLCCQVELAGCVLAILAEYNAVMKMQHFPQIFFG